MLRTMPRSNRWPYVFFNDGDEGWYVSATALPYAARLDG